MEKVINILSSIHLDSIDCTKSMRELIKHKKDEISIKEKVIDQNTIDRLQPLIHDHSQESDLRFVIFYTILTYHRINVSPTKYNEFVDIYKNYFNTEEYPLMWIVYAHYYNNINIHQKAIENAEQALRVIPNHQGVKQTYADFIAIALEHEEDIPDSIIDKALNQIEEEIKANNNYAKYYCTKGRLLYHQNPTKESFCEARELILKAIDIEDPSRPDFEIRKTQYYYYLMEIKTKESSRVQIQEFKTTLDSEMAKTKELLDSEMKKTKELLANEISNTKDLLDAQRSKYLEILAFFASMVAIVISTVINAQQPNKTFNESSSLLLILAGVLIMSYGGLRVLFSYNKEEGIESKTYLVLFLSILLIIAGFFIGNFVQAKPLFFSSFFFG
ncbi:hypothetical protein [Parabacteroides sp. PF5-9]|uniref:hypothetical protein n=1 Tax=Parabacteroides sp. PF5-9 TaxID=1742404 RepID=UPI002474A939|nr:hypothetical protein [Parabacteroides sp. PF5-9]MDH6358632.1 tetratricopeptide (TPR) repeat protein [Parabacteroides sp. PF5-9]